MATAKKAAPKKSTKKAPVSKDKTKKEKSSKTGVIIGFSALAALLLSGGFILIVKNKNKDKETAKEKDPFNVTIPPVTSSTTTHTTSTVKPTVKTSTTAAPTPAPGAPAPPPPVVATISQSQAEAIAEGLRRATYINQTSDYGINWPLLTANLAKIKNVKDYELVNTVFLEISFTDRLKGEVSQSIVTKLMGTYGKYLAYNTWITKEFIRMGLKRSAEGKWSLYGLDGTQVHGKGNPGEDNCRGRLVKAKSSLVALNKNTQEQTHIASGTVIGHIFQILPDETTEIVNKEGTFYAPTKSLILA